MPGRAQWGIAQATVLAGYKVWLYDVAADVLDDALQQIEASVAKGVSLGKVSEEQAGQVERALMTTTELAALAEADLIIEAAPEAIEIKRELFEKLDGLAAEEAILASNRILPECARRLHARRPTCCAVLPGALYPPDWKDARLWPQPDARNCARPNQTASQGMSAPAPPTAVWSAWPGSGSRA